MGTGIGALLASGRVAELVGVDLNETVVARARWPRARFLCADAARLPAAYCGAFAVVLIRRPDLLAQPVGGRWRAGVRCPYRRVRPVGAGGDLRWREELS